MNPDKNTSPAKKQFIQVPMVVLADNNLSSTEKLFIGLMISLSRQKGYCFASNATIGKYINKDGKTVSKIVNRLRPKGWINCEYDRSNYRRIYLVEQKLSSKKVIALAEKGHSSSRKSGEAIAEKEDNNREENTELNTEKKKAAAQPNHFIPKDKQQLFKKLKLI